MKEVCFLQQSVDKYGAAAARASQKEGNQWFSWLWKEAKDG